VGQKGFDNTVDFTDMVDDFLFGSALTPHTSLQKQDDKTFHISAPQLQGCLRFSTRKASRSRSNVPELSWWIHLFSSLLPSLGLTAKAKEEVVSHTTVKREKGNPFSKSLLPL
jgi:hypothetical protein